MDTGALFASCWVHCEMVDYLTDPHNKALPYFDLPLQHVNSDLLRAMNRPYGRDQIERLLDEIRGRCPDAVIRATFIVGFPGETRAMFEELFEFVERQKLHRVAGFAYSREEGTPAAELPRQVTERTKYGRLDRLMSLQRDIALTRNSILMGSRQLVMLDCLQPDGVAIGRTKGDCPEIDQQVYVEGESLQVGQIGSVLIDEVDGYDLRGRWAGGSR